MRPTNQHVGMVSCPPIAAYVLPYDSTPQPLYDNQRIPSTTTCLRQRTLCGPIIGWGLWARRSLIGSGMYNAGMSHMQKLCRVLFRDSGVHLGYQNSTVPELCPVLTRCNTFIKYANRG